MKKGAMRLYGPCINYLIISYGFCTELGLA